MDSAAGSRNHIDPEKEIPWIAIRRILSDSTYGGRVDGIFDRLVLSGFLESIFNESSFKPGFRPGTVEAPLFPEPGSSEAMMSWVDALPDVNPPTWIGLSNASEDRLLENAGKRVLHKLALLQDGGIDEVAPTESESGGAQSSDDTTTTTTTSKLSMLKSKICTWLQDLQVHEKSTLLAVRNLTVATALASSSSSSGSDDASSSSLTRCISREVEKGSLILNKVLYDLNLVKEFCDGLARPTNQLRSLVSELGRGQTPLQWRKSYRASNTCSASADTWLADFSLRIKHVLSLAEPFNTASSSTSSSENVSVTKLENLKFWLGGLFNPESFITSSRQHTAEMTGIALDDLVPTLILYKSINIVDNVLNDHSFNIVGLVLEGSGYNDKEQELTLSDGTIKTIVKTAQLKWISKFDEKNGTNSNESLCRIEIPLYLNEGRSVLLTSMELARNKLDKKQLFYQRGAALLAWNGTP